MKPPRSRSVARAAALFLAAALGALSACQRSHVPMGEVAAQPQLAPEFTLVDHHGKPLHAADLRGSVVLLTFGFTHCPNICLLTLAQLANAVKDLPAQEQARVRVVFVSVDPPRDTPEKLREYVGFFHPDFIGATGTPAQIEAAARAYKVFYDAEAPRPDGNYNVSHSARVYVLDRQGRLVTTYEHAQLSERERITKDLHHYASAD